MRVERTAWGSTLGLHNLHIKGAQVMPAGYDTTLIDTKEASVLVRRGRDTINSWKHRGWLVAVDTYQPSCGGQRADLFRRADILALFERLERKRLDTKPCLPMSQLNCAYLAGLFDGEGCFNAFSRSRIRSAWQYGYKGSISMTDGYPLKWALSATGLGNLYHYPARSLKHKSVYHWHIYGRETSSLARVILPYLKVKVRQAEIILDLDDLRFNPSREDRRILSEPLIRELYVLNQRGGKIGGMYESNRP